MISRRTGREANFEPMRRRKVSRNYTNEVRITFGEAHAQGQRKSMEDAQISCTKMRIQPGSCVKSDQRNNVQFHAIFDGHGGSEVAEYLSKNLLSVVEKYLSSESTVETAIKKAFQKTDDMIMKSGMSSGSTCIAMLIEEATSTAWTINVGDSRCVMDNGFSTRDAKPTRPDEMERIELAGGCVVNQRVSGVLAVSRSFGDRLFKPYVISEPEITKMKLEKQDKFAILACDGLWDVLSPGLACRLVADGLALGADADNICWSLVTMAIQERDSMDNVSVILLNFSHSRGSF